MEKIKNGQDETLLRNNYNLIKRLHEEHLEIKAKKHARYNKVEDLYKANGISRQGFYKYLNKYKQNPTPEGVAPLKRGAKFKKRRTALYSIEESIIRLREQGFNRYEIHMDLLMKYKKFAPSPSTIYNVLKDKGLNVLKPKMKQSKRKIIKEKAGEMAHIDCYNLPRGLIELNKQHYLVGVIDDASRIAWVKLIEDKTALTVMFATLDIFNMLKYYAKIEFIEILSDNGSEFRGGKEKSKHPFERLLIELNIKHRYTKPYRPQTNGKIERFWKTLFEEMIEDTDYDNRDEFEQTLMEYLVYYNEARPHSSLGGKSPKMFLNFCPRIT
jgi:hypothetical protein